MGLGKFVIDVELDTASAPDDTVLLAAQGARTRIYIQELDAHVRTLEAATVLHIEDGVGGNVIGVLALTAIGTFHIFLQPGNGDGHPIALNTLLNATTEGGQAMELRVTGTCIVRGG